MKLFEKADATMFTGYWNRPDGQEVDGLGLVQVRAAAELYKAGFTSKIVFPTGRVNPPHLLSEAMKSSLLRVAEGQIQIDEADVIALNYPNARDTRGEIKAFLDHSQKEKWRRVYIVALDPHSKRVEQILDRTGVLYRPRVFGTVEVLKRVLGGGGITRESEEILNSPAGRVLAHQERVLQLVEAIKLGWVLDSVTDASPLKGRLQHGLHGVHRLMMR